VLKVIAAAMASLLLLSGCGSGVYDLPLPGGADLGDRPYTVKLRFHDVLDLVPNAAVRVNEVPVGRVSEVKLAPNSWDAQVTVELNGKVKLPGNATARLRQSSLLGEKFVELQNPPAPEPPTGRLHDGSVIGVDRTGRNPEVEEVLGALSLLLNGGGVAQIQGITKELNNALSGREGDVRGLMQNLNTTVSGLDAQRDDITRALDSVNRLSASLNRQRGDIDVALRDLPGGLKVLNDQRQQLVNMLQAMNRLSNVSTDVVNQSQGDMVRNLRDLQPTVNQLAAAGSDLPKSLQLMFTYPFTDDSIQGIKGDYTNLYIDADLNLTDILTNVGKGKQPLVAPPDPVKNLLPPLPLPKQPAPSAPAPPPAQDNGGGLLGGLLGGN
jgi:phospholipid/cholesterol/gamma-HCH transport system substrate-binding protein